MAKKQVLMLIGGEYHPFEECAAVFKAFVEASGRYAVDVTDDRDVLKAESLARYDAVVLYTQGGELKKPQLDGLLGFVSKGGALMGVHGALASFAGHDAYVDMVGGRFKSHGPVTEFPVSPTDVASVITRRMPAFRIVDEIYLLDRFGSEDTEVIATAHWHGATVPMAYTKGYGRGRVFVMVPGHDLRAFNHPSFQKLALRGLDWTLAVRSALR